MLGRKGSPIPADFDPAEREWLRMSAESISATLTDAEKASAGQAAYPLIDVLREICGSDVPAARVSQLIAALFATLQGMPVSRISDTLDGSCAAYAFAAGSLAGVYELPKRDKRYHVPEPEVDEVDETPHPGQYL